MTPVFIVGCDRSGTTITKRIVSKSLGIKPMAFEPRLLIDGELGRGLMIAAWRNFEYEDASNTKRWIMRQYDIDERRGWKQFFNKDEFVNRVDGVLGNLQESKEDSREKLNGFVKEIHRVIFERTRGNNLYFVDDTPANCLIIKELAEVFPEAKIIHCIRDGREVVKSIKDRGWWSKDDRIILNKWLSIVRNGRAMGKLCNQKNYTELSFGDTASSPESSYGKLIEWVNQDASLDLTNFDSSKKRKADRNWGLEEYYKTVAGDLIDEFGWL